MRAEKREGTWIQCSYCGKVYYIDWEVPIDKVYITSHCPRCEYDRGLNLGDNRDEFYELYDVNLDKRYY